jgi:hypothetical protein
MADHDAAHGPALLALHVLPIAVFALLLLLDLGDRRGLRMAGRLLSGLRHLPPALRVALLLVLVSATVHISMVPGHLTQPVTAALFALDAMAEAALCVMACCGLRRWRELGGTLMAANLAVYAGYVMGGLERPDGVGVATKLVELAALALLSLSVGESFVVGGMKVTSS